MQIIHAMLVAEPRLYLDEIRTNLVGACGCKARYFARKCARCSEGPWIHQPVNRARCSSTSYGKPKLVSRHAGCRAASGYPPFLFHRRDFQGQRRHEETTRIWPARGTNPVQRTISTNDFILNSCLLQPHGFCGLEVDILNLTGIFYLMI